MPAASATAVQVDDIDVPTGAGRLRAVVSSSTVRSSSASAWCSRSGVSDASGEVAVELLPLLPQEREVGGGAVDAAMSVATQQRHERPMRGRRRPSPRQ